MGATVSVCGFYILSQIQAGAGWWRRIVDIPFVLAVGIGLAVNNTRAVIEACVGYRTPFARTPKLALDDQSSIPGNQLAYRGKLTLTPVVGIMFGLVYVYSATYCVQLSVWTALPFMVLFAVGFLYLGCTSLIQGVFIRRRTRSPVTSQPTA